ncbi:MAG: DUF2490 domain-containing protein [Treponema sp.]|nr:DUF2490 domain-containing protein [Treponema sp.]
MKRLFTILALLLPLAAGAQVYYNDYDTEFGGRMSLTLDKKIRKGLHVSAEAEVRLKENTGTIGRYQAGVGISWKASDLFKFGAGYIFIEKQNSSSIWKPRHRFYGDVAATLHAGDWRFSLKERLQLTHRDGINRFQNTPNSLSLKSRLKVAYKGFLDWTPYGYIELRNVFNDPTCKATWSSTYKTFVDYTFTGYDGAYFNRCRGVLGTEWKLSKTHSFDFFIMGDYCYDKVVDTDRTGTAIYSLGFDRGFRLSAGIGYTFSF